MGNTDSSKPKANETEKRTEKKEVTKTEITPEYNPGTTGYILICGSYESAYGGDMSALGAMLEHIKNAEVPDDNICIIADTRGIEKQDRVYKCDGRLRLGGRDYASVVVQYLKIINPAGRTSLPGAGEVHEALRKLTGKTNIKEIQIWYWDHGSAHGLGMPDKSASLTVTQLSLLLNNIGEATVRSDAYGGSIRFLLVVDCCGSTEALKRALKETMLVKPFPAQARIVLITSSDGANLTWNSLFVLLENDVILGGVSQLIRTLSKLFIYSTIGTWTWNEVAQKCNEASQAYQVNVLMGDREVVHNWVNPNVGLGDLENKGSIDDRLPGKTSVMLNEHLLAIRINRDGACLCTMLMPEEYKKWRAFRQEEDRQTLQSTISLEEAIHALETQDPFMGNFEYNSLSGPLPVPELVDFVLDTFEDASVRINLLCMLMPGISKGSFTEKQVKDALRAIVKKKHSEDECAV